VTRIEEIKNAAEFWWGNILVKADLEERIWDVTIALTLIDK
jgi:hypothetical protein